jgi:uncharacterized protein (TIGR00255 family)
MRSMTGFGKADYKSKELNLSVEVTSVNNRFLEYSIRMPKQLFFLEPRVKELIAAKLNRGKVNLTLNYEDNGIGIDRLVINRSLADELLRELKNLKKRYKLGGELELEEILAFPEIFRVEKSSNIEKKIWPSVSKTINKALDDLVAMREKEGENLKKDIMKRMAQMAGDIEGIEKGAKEHLAIYREKLSRRIAEVLDNRTLDGARLEEEVAYFAERADVTEECVRFRSHLKQFQLDLKQTGPVGKRLNFILQELNREANTIGSKAAGVTIPGLALQLKEEIEKVREQVQNIE